MNFLIDCGLDTSYFLEFPPRDIIGSKAQQHASVSVEVSSNTSDHSDHTSSFNDAAPFNVTSENKEHDRKRRKLDHLIDSAGDGSSGGAGGGVRRRGQFLVEPPEFSSIDWNSIDFIFITICWLYLMLLSILILKERFMLLSLRFYLDGKTSFQF